MLITTLQVETTDSLFNQPRLSKKDLVATINKIKQRGQIHPIATIIRDDGTKTITDNHLDYLAIQWLHENNIPIRRLNKNTYYAVVK